MLDQVIYGCEAWEACQMSAASASCFCFRVPPRVEILSLVPTAEMHGGIDAVRQKDIFIVRAASDCPRCDP
jgi:hypothetical protein